MGVDAADFDGTGRPGFVVGNFSNEMIALYKNEGDGLFTDQAPSGAIGKASQMTLTFATFFFDYDLDGLPDLFAANGHVSDDINAVQPKIRYAEPPHLFRNVGKGAFEAVTAKMGEALQRAMVARGAAYGDYDNDGDLDLLVTTNNGPARLLRNDGANQNDVLRLKLVGGPSNRDGIGARVTLTGGAHILNATVKTGSSYCSQSELPLTFGLGKGSPAVTVQVIWPSGRVDEVKNVSPNQSIVLAEGRGVTTADPIVFSRPAPPNPQTT
jgi:hypothetical protein